MKMKAFIPALFVAGMICFSSVQDANAYFTTYVTAKGGYEVAFKRETHIDEEFENWNKYVTITSKKDSIPVYVRVKAFSGSMYTLSYSGDNWVFSEKDGYYYYTVPLNGGETTKALRIFIDQIPVNPKEEQNFNVIVVYETTAVQYNEQNKPVSPQDADWSKTLSSISTVVPETSQEEQNIVDGGETNK